MQSKDSIQLLVWGESTCTPLEKSANDLENTRVVADFLGYVPQHTLENGKIFPT